PRASNRTLLRIPWYTCHSSGVRGARSECSLMPLATSRLAHTADKLRARPALLAVPRARTRALVSFSALLGVALDAVPFLVATKPFESIPSLVKHPPDEIRRQGARAMRSHGPAAQVIGAIVLGEDYSRRSEGGPGEEWLNIAPQCWKYL